MGSPRRIQLSKYLRHYAQLQTTVNSPNEWGDSTAVATVQTVSCLYYYGSTRRDLNDQLKASNLKHSCLLYSSVTVKPGDKLISVTDRAGLTFISAARITQVEPYTYWDDSRGIVLKEVTLEFN
jgi:hypothetical protein